MPRLKEILTAHKYIAVQHSMMVRCSCGWNHNPNIGDDCWDMWTDHVDEVTDRHHLRDPDPKVPLPSWNPPKKIWLRQEPSYLEGIVAFNPVFNPRVHNEELDIEYQKVDKKK